MERKEETFEGAGAMRSCTTAPASQCEENSLSATLSSKGRMSGRTSAGFDDDSSPAHNHGCTRQTERSMRASSSSSSQDDDMNADDSSCNSGKAKKKKPKLDRSKLRKGKWTVRSLRDLKEYLSSDGDLDLLARSTLPAYSLLSTHSNSA